MVKVPIKLCVLQFPHLPWVPLCYSTCGGIKPLCGLVVLVPRERFVVTTVTLLTIHSLHLCDLRGTALTFSSVGEATSADVLHLFSTQFIAQLHAGYSSVLSDL